MLPELEPCREIRTHEPSMLRRYAVVASASLIDSPTPDWLSGIWLPVRLTKATSRVSSATGSPIPWVIGRGRTHEVERTDLPTGFSLSIALQVSRCAAIPAGSCEQEA